MTFVLNKSSLFDIFIAEEKNNFINILKLKNYGSNKEKQ